MRFLLDMVCFQQGKQSSAPIISCHPGCPIESSSTYQHLQAPSSHLGGSTPSPVVENNPFITVTPSYNMFRVTLRNLESHHWVKSNAFNLMSLRYKLNFQWSCHSKQSHHAQIVPLRVGHIVLYISLTSLKHIPINYLRDIPFYTHYGWFYPQLLLVKWPKAAGH